MPDTMSAGGRRRFRDRRGRGLRGTLLPVELPGHRTRSERFDDLVLDGVERLETRWAAQLAEVEFAVEDVPPADHGDVTLEPVLLARTEPGIGRGKGSVPPRVIIYRRPVEARAHGGADLADLVFDLLVHEIAALLGQSPETIDPEGHPPGDDPP